MHRSAMAFCGLVFTAAACAEPVTVHTFVRAETDTAIQLIHEKAGFGAFVHSRKPTALDEQFVIRMNRDTLYSTAVLDLTTPATVQLPDAKGRYMSLHVINQDHYSFAQSEPGTYELTQNIVGSPYAYLIVRTFIDADDPEDIKAANALQDKIVIEGGGNGPLDIPDWDHDPLQEARGAMNTLAKLGTDTARSFGTKEETDPIDHMIGAAAGWGGLPQKNAFYELRTPKLSDGTPHQLNLKNVPVDAFWSVTVYNADGYIDKNALGIYSFNSITAKPNPDGSYSIHFGNCKDGRVNCLPISKGWNYAARMYEPRAEILDGTWKFPVPETTNVR